MMLTSNPGQFTFSWMEMLSEKPDGQKIGSVFYGTSTKETGFWLMMKICWLWFLLWSLASPKQDFQKCHVAVMKFLLTCVVLLAPRIHSESLWDRTAVPFHVNNILCLHYTKILEHSVVFCKPYFSKLIAPSSAPSPRPCWVYVSLTDDFCCSHPWIWSLPWGLSTWCSHGGENFPQVTWLALSFCPGLRWKNHSSERGLLLVVPQLSQHLISYL